MEFSLTRRKDLHDEGSGHFFAAYLTVRLVGPGATVYARELIPPGRLIGDFQGDVLVGLEILDPSLTVEQLVAFLP